MLSDQELADYFSGTLTDTERRAFEERVFDEPDAMKELVQQRRLHTALKALLDPAPEAIEAGILARVRGVSDEAVVSKVLAETTGRAISRPVAHPVKAAGRLTQPRPHGNPRERWWTAFQAFSSVAAGAAAIVLLIYGSTWFGRDPGRQPQGNGVIAEIRGDSHARWGARQRALRWGDELRREPLVLDSGVVELAFRNGTKLVAEGPARLDLESVGQVVLHHGKVSAHVPPTATGFTIETAAGKIVDRGTTFGVKASRAGLVEAHVFEGRVDVTPGGQFTAPTKILKREMAMRLDPQAGAVSVIASDSREFPQAGQVIAEPLRQADFEDLLAIKSDGMPIGVGEWGGDVAEIVGRQSGILPHSGDRMLSFVLTGAGPVHGRETSVWSASEQWQFVDLAPYKEAIENGVTAELSAWFNRVSAEDAVNEFVVVLAAYRGSPDEVKNHWWPQRPEMALAYSQDTIKTDDDPTTWERDEVRFEVPAGANLLLVSIAAAKSNPAERLHGHFADSVALRLVIPPRGAVHAQR